jgi:hypothetical protein
MDTTSRDRYEGQANMSGEVISHDYDPDFSHAMLVSC